MACAYKRNRKRLDFPIENEKGAILALTMRLRRRGKLGHRRYHTDLIGGKGGTRTLDPGIMSADGRDQVSDFSTLGQAAVAAKCLKVHRRAGEIPANLPRTNLYCQRPAARGRSAALRYCNHRRTSRSADRLLAPVIDPVRSSLGMREAGWTSYEDLRIPADIASSNRRVAPLALSLAETAPPRTLRDMSVRTPRPPRVLR